MATIGTVTIRPDLKHLKLSLWDKFRLKVASLKKGKEDLYEDLLYDYDYYSKRFIPKDTGALRDGETRSKSKSVTRVGQHDIIVKGHNYGIRYKAVQYSPNSVTPYAQYAYDFCNWKIAFENSSQYQKFLDVAHTRVSEYLHGK